MIQENIEYRKDTQIAIIFNKCFVSSIKENRSSIDVQYENQISVINSKFKFSAINLPVPESVFLKVLRRNQITQKYQAT